MHLPFALHGISFAAGRQSDRFAGSSATVMPQPHCRLSARNGHLLRSKRMGTFRAKWRRLGFRRCTNSSPYAFGSPPHRSRECPNHLVAILKS